MENQEKIHPRIYDLKGYLEKGKLTRRDFLRYATLLGMSAAAASQMIGFTWPRKPVLGKVDGSRSGCHALDAPPLGHHGAQSGIYCR